MSDVRGIIKRHGTYWLDRFVEDGLRRQANLGTDSLEEAKKRAHDPEFMMQHGIPPPAKGVGPEFREADAAAATLGEMIGRYFYYHQVRASKAPDTLRTNKWSFDKLVRWLPEGAATRVRSISPAIARDFLRWAGGKGYAASSVNNIHIGTRALFQWIVAEHPHVIIDNPFPPIVASPPPAISDKRICSAADRKLLIDGAKDPNLKFILYCGFHAGLRRREIMEARADWFNMDFGFLQVKRAVGPPRLRGRNERPFNIKNKKERRIPLTPEFREFLGKYLRNRDPLDYALRPKLRHHAGSPERYNFHSKYSIYMGKMGYGWVTIHTMRHTFASLLAQAGVPMIKIARWLGDSLIVTDRHYTILDPTDDDILKGHVGI